MVPVFIAYRRPLLLGCPLIRPWSSLDHGIPGALNRSDENWMNNEIIITLFDEEKEVVTKKVSSIGVNLEKIEPRSNDIHSFE